MWYQFLADLIVCLHAAFVLFVVFGGLIVLKWPSVMWLHLPAALWGALIELGGWVCPLTPLENWLRVQAGAAGYHGDFIARYLLPVLYPEHLTREVQLILGGLVLVINMALYGWIWRRTQYR